MEKNVFDSIKIGLASPDMIRSWSHGEVTKPETINYRTLKPEKDGLFCEKIFGPTKDWECSCGRYKRVKFKGKVCERCGVEVTSKKVRRERMGHVELAAPVSHLWYFKATPSRIATLLDISPKSLERILYFASYIVLDSGETPLVKGSELTEGELRDAQERYGEDSFKVGMGAEAIEILLKEIDTDALTEQLKEEMRNSSGQKKVKIIKRLEVAEAFRKSGNRPEWMILNVIPVIPPDIRPMVQLDGGRFAASDLNDLYRRVINRNNRLARLIELDSPDIIIRNEKRMLQEAVDTLIDNGKHGKPVTGPSSRPLKSLSEMLRGKQGRFRQNLLGKRVDYSGRSVIVVGPELKIYQCGLPKEMALELFKPFVMRRLVETGKAANVKEAKKKVEHNANDVWDALEVVIKDHPVLLNRAPTLHRLSIQAFEPVLVEGRAIKLHPLVCTAFNADFDGDQMPVHVPLSVEAQAESRFLMLSANNLLKPADGKAVTVPTQDMVLGSYYLTIVKGDPDPDPATIHCYRNFDEAVMAYENHLLDLHEIVNIRVEKEIDGVKKSKLVTTTLGRMIFNKNIPQDIGYVDRSNPENAFKLEVDKVVKKKDIGDIIDHCIAAHGLSVTAEMLDKIKATGFKYSTKGALSISIADITVPKEKPILIKEAEQRVEEIREHYLMGELTDDERYKQVISTWEDTTEKITKKMSANFDTFNPIKMMSDSGARGNITQMRQLAGMRGIMTNTTGRSSELPVKSNFREGLNILEYFSAARGARKALSDTALRTADSGYLTRRLVVVAQNVIIREDDCHSQHGMWVSRIGEGKEVIEELKDRLVGRYVIGDVINPSTGEVMVRDGEMISIAQADAIDKAGVEKVQIRTVLQCKAKHGVCAHCYGADLASGNPVNVGEAVGIIAAQSIGEPGTQLTMRNFHTGGVAGASDITQGLPRVEELFEARRPTKTAIISEVSGTVSFTEIKRTRGVVITPEPGSDEETKTYPVNYGINILVHEGDYITKGTPLTEGALSPQDICRISGLDAAYDYVIREVQRVYRGQGVKINDKHIEVITRQMTRNVKITASGDTELLEGTVVDVSEFNAANNEIEERIARGEIALQKAEADPMLLGITKASLHTDSFLSAASFQETTRVLTDAAIRGKTDNLLGLMENVIIGKLIPAGTGMERYRNIDVDAGGEYISEELMKENAK